MDQAGITLAKLLGACIECKAWRPMPGRDICQWCKGKRDAQEAAMQAKRQARKEYQQGRYNHLKKQGICPFCLGAALPGKVACDTCTQRKVGYHRLKKYGLTEKQYQVMLNAQHNKCKVCSVLFGNPKSSEGCVIDHDHDTGKIRGLLCNTCNSILGFIELRSGVDHLNQLKEYVLEKIGDKQRSLALPH